MKDKSYTFFESYHKALSRMNDESYGRIVRHISEYVFYDAVPDLKDDAEYIAWELIKPILDHRKTISDVRADSGRTGGEHGKGVTRNKGNSNATKSIANNSKSIANNSKTIAETKANNSGIGIGIGVGKGEDIIFLSEKYRELPFDKRKELFLDDINKYREGYDTEFLNRFYYHWSQMDMDGKTMRFENEEYWGTKERLKLFK